MKSLVCIASAPTDIMDKSYKFRIDCIVGARPNFVKIAPIMHSLAKREGIYTRLIHTGQHYDYLMNAVFFQELNITEPDINLEIGGGTNTEQTARIMLALEPVFSTTPPDLLIVVGDVNSTLAASLVAAKLGIPIAHVEAGLRSFDRAMPEEINRLVTDRLADLLFASEPAGVDNLKAENTPQDQIVLVGNVMIDTLFATLVRAIAPADTFAEIGASPAFRTAVTNKGFGFVTLHRPSNVDERNKLAALLNALIKISSTLPLIFPIHPRTQAMIRDGGLESLIPSATIATCPPLSYLRAIGLMREAKVVITDSGGVQEETTALGTPCLTVRENTERPVTIVEGTNTLIGTDPTHIIEAVDIVLRDGGKRGRRPQLWDGQAAERIVSHSLEFLRSRNSLKT
jgi:UDP-N-acetylglucosamine 2-epimerase (non-hydrolysing)